MRRDGVALFGKIKSSAPPVLAQGSPLTVSEGDLARASQLMEQWDAALGNSDAVYDCLEAIARQGGWKGEAATTIEAMDFARNGGAVATVTQRPWQWWG